MTTDSPVVVLFNSDGYEVNVKNGVALPTIPTAILSAGTDGTNSRFIRVDSSGHPIMVGPGTAGTPSGGLITIQGDPAGSPIPITGSITVSEASVGLTGSPIPTSANQIGASDGTNLQVPRVFDLDTGGGTQYSLGVNLRLSSSGGSVEAGTNTNPIRIDPTGSTTQPISAASLPLPSGAATESTLSTRLADATFTSRINTLGQKTSANSTPIVIASDQSVIPVSQSGSWTVTANAGTGNFNVIGTGTAGTPASGVLTIQGIAGGTAVPISGSITASNASIGLNGSAIPTSSTQTGGSDGTNLQAFRVFDVDSGAGTQYVQGINLRLSASGGSVEFGTNTNPIRIDPTGTTTQPISAASLPLPTGAATETTLSTRLADATFTARINTLGQKTSANSTPVVIASDQSAIPVSQSGSWTVTSNIGTTNGLALDTTLAKLTIAQSTALGANTQAMVGGSVTTAAPTYTTGNINPLSLTTAGALRIDGSGTTQPVSGTVTAAQATAANLNATVVQGTAANLRSQTASESATGATTPALAGLSGGTVTTAAPTYTTGNLGALSLTTAGSLRIDGSGVTQPVSGTITANAGTGNFTVVGTATDNTTNSTAKLPVMAAVSTTAAPTYTTGNMVPLSVDTAGALRITGTITATNASISATGAAPPAQATYIGGSVTTAAPTYTTGQMNALSLTTAGALRIDGSGTTQPVSGTVTANIGTTNGLALDATVAKLTITQGTALGANTQALVGGSVTTAAPTYTTGNINPFSLTTAGALRTDSSATTQPVSGTVTVAQATAANLNATVVQATAANLRTQTASESTTATATGTVANLIGGAVTTAAPTYTTGQMNPLSLTTTGALRTDSSGTTQPVSGTVTVTQTTASNLNAQVQGAGASGAAVTGNPVLVAGSDGTNARTLKTLTDGSQIYRYKELATFTGVATDIAIGNNKSMFSIVNASGSTVVSRISAIYLVNVQTSAVTGVIGTFELRRITNHSAGTAITAIEKMDSNDTLSSSITLRTNGTVTSESTNLLWRAQFSTDEIAANANLDTSFSSHIFGTMFPVWKRADFDNKPIILNANEGLTVKFSTNSTAGTFDIMVVFTQE